MSHAAWCNSVLKWFSALYVVLIVIQVYLAGEGIFGLNVIKHSDDCDKKGAVLNTAPCIGNSRRSMRTVRSDSS